MLFSPVLEPLLDGLVPDHEPEAFRLGSVFRAVEVEVAEGTVFGTNLVPLRGTDSRARHEIEA